MVATYKARQAAGKPVLLSLGGSGGAANGLASTAAQDKAIASLTTIVETWGFSGVDWDLESSSPPDPQGCARVSRELRKRFGDGFMITMAPFSLVTAQYRQMAKLLQETGDLTWVGFQFYNRETVTAATIIAEADLIVEVMGGTEPTRDYVLAALNAHVTDSEREEIRRLLDEPHDDEESRNA